MPLPVNEVAIIIQAKDKKIAEIKMEVKKLKAQIETLRAKLYEKMQLRCLYVVNVRN